MKVNPSVKDIEKARIKGSKLLEDVRKRKGKRVSIDDLNEILYREAMKPKPNMGYNKIPRGGVTR